MRRIVGSTSAAETQSLLNGLGHAEWIAAHFAEARFPNFDVAQRSIFLRHFQSMCCGWNPLIWQICVCIMRRVVAQPTVKQIVVLHFANGKRTKENPHVSQDVLKEITVSQSTYALKINKVTVAEIRSLRECNGAVRWPRRVDLAVQVSCHNKLILGLIVDNNAIEQNNTMS